MEFPLLDLESPLLELESTLLELEFTLLNLESITRIGIHITRIGNLNIGYVQRIHRKNCSRFHSKCIFSNTLLQTLIVSASASLLSYLKFRPLSKYYKKSFVWNFQKCFPFKSIIPKFLAALECGRTKFCSQTFLITETATLIEPGDEGFKFIIESLTHLSPMFHFYTPWKYL